MPAMLSRIHAPSCHVPLLFCTGQAVMDSVRWPRCTVSASGSPPLVCSSACTCSVEEMCRPLTAVMMSPSRRPHWRAGQSLFSVRPTTNTPSAKSLMPTAFPKGITVFSSAGEAKACCQHRESANTTASSHPALRRIVEVLRVSYKLLTPRFLLFCRRDSFTLRRGCPTHEMKKQVELENGAVERNLRAGKIFLTATGIDRLWTGGYNLTCMRVRKFALEGGAGCGRSVL